jgi:2-furoyl-CoA dehydrogenase large subunit
LDTSRDAWSIASGNYSSRFAAAVGGAAHLAALKVKTKLSKIAASQLNVPASEIEFAGGRVRAHGNPDNAIAFSRLAATSHWSPGLVPEENQALRETVFWTPPELTPPTEDDEINSSLCHGFIFDFCGVEIDSTTGAVRIDKYVTMHDCGRILHPGMVAGQITGGFAHAVGAALYEEYAYGQDGSFLTGTFADYLVPTTMEVASPVILHIETPSPYTPLGAKGVGEGNCMSTPVCIANAVADALGIAAIDLPLTPAKICAHLHGAEREKPGPTVQAETSARPRGRALRGSGQARAAASPEAVWAVLLDPKTLEAIIPGCHRVEKLSDTHFRADVTLGVGPVTGRYKADIQLSDLTPPKAVTLSGHVVGALGAGRGAGRITLTATENGSTDLAYEYDAEISGKVATIAGRLLDGAAKIVIRQFFEALARHTGGPRKRSWFARLFRRHA